MENRIEDLKPGVRRRLEFIDFRLFWDGRFSRKALAHEFAISDQQASADIKAYEGVAPGNLAYDRSRKTYLRTGGFEPVFMKKSPDRYLLQLMAIKSNLMDREDTWFDELPMIEVLSLRKRPIDASILLGILDAVRLKQEITIGYHSMTGSTAAERSIAPHSLASSGSRWYVRAWSREHNDFRDYSLSRISEVSDPRPSTVDPKLDFQWEHTIDLILVPNPELEKPRQDAAAVDFDMKEGRCLVSARLSMCFYLIAEMNLDVAPKILPAVKQQVVLLNFDEVRQAIDSARQLSIQALRRAAAKP